MLPFCRDKLNGKLSWVFLPSKVHKDAHSGFDLSDRPILTYFVQENFQRRILFFLVRATTKIKTVLDQKIFPK